MKQAKKLQILALSTATAMSPFLGAAAALTGSSMPVHAVQIIGRWQRVDNHWTFIQSNGRLAVNKWLQIDGLWYNFDNLGYMRTGWFRDGHTWYFLKSGGNMAQNEWVRFGGIWYRFNSSGQMVTGWAYINGNWYYFNDSGEMQTGWLHTQSTWYYLHPNGSMAKKWNQINGNWYYFDANGRMAMREWIDEPHSNITTQWESYYVDGTGKWTDTKTVYKYGYTPDNRPPACGSECVTDEKIAALRYELEQAKYDLTKAETAWGYVKSDYETAKAEQSIGFFKYMGWDNVEEWLNKDFYGGESTTASRNYRRHGKALGEYTHVGDPCDATSLENMKKSIDLLSAFNEKYRYELNSLPRLKVNNFDFLAAQLTANYVDTHYEHPYAFNLTDCVLQTRYDPYKTWYSEEKVSYDVGNYATCQNYMELINPYYLNTGLAVSTRHTLTNADSFAQILGQYNTRLNGKNNAGQPDMTLESYSVLFQKYYDNYKDMENRKERYENALEKVDDLQAQLDKMLNRW